ncbi:MAG: diguanylate cyclase [Prochloraceae cyanobacterium]|nr:diguanylate cyclase [Prochloraceae cyanobacterium]
MVDAHQLLVAYAQIHELTSSSMKKINKKLEEANRQLEKVVKLDMVTGFGNERVFEKYLNREWKRAGKEKIWLSVIRFDIDFFKEYKDVYGKLAGDELLRKIATPIRKVFKRPADLVTHYGEGKFGIVLPNTNVFDADRVADRIIEKIKKLEIVNPQSKINDCLTISLGVASMKPSPLDSQKLLISIAEHALDRAKQTGRNRKMLGCSEHLAFAKVIE